jgi:hypothetical protein
VCIYIYSDIYTRVYLNIFVLHLQARIRGNVTQNVLMYLKKTD